jgi:NADH-quinone oxidoreductase subunit C
VTVALVESLQAALPGAVEETVEFRGETTVIIGRERLLAVLAFLRDQAVPPLAVLTDLTVVDRLPAVPRFDVVYLLTSYDPPARLRVKTRVPADDPVVPSTTALWPGANWLEREGFDLYGIRFSGHPDLTRILLPDDWEGHPLRRDYPLVEEPVEFVDRVPKVPSEIIPQVPPKGE